MSQRFNVFVRFINVRKLILHIVRKFVSIRVWSLEFGVFKTYRWAMMGGRRELTGEVIDFQGR